MLLSLFPARYRAYNFHHKEGDRSTSLLSWGECSKEWKCSISPRYLVFLFELQSPNSPVKWPSGPAVVDSAWREKGLLWLHCIGGGGERAFKWVGPYGHKPVELGFFCISLSTRFTRWLFKLQSFAVLWLFSIKAEGTDMQVSVTHLCILLAWWQEQDRQTAKIVLRFGDKGLYHLSGPFSVWSSELQHDLR